jgi:AraC-like DNA-binding protein
MKPETKNDINLARIKTVQDYIRLHYGDELKLSELAALANLVPTSLCHIFKAYTEHTVSDFITEVRIKKAADKLLNTNETVKGIAYECGFSTLTNFNRHFKKFMGCTPTELRAQYQRTTKQKITNQY